VVVAPATIAAPGSGGGGGAAAPAAGQAMMAVPPVWALQAAMFAGVHGLIGARLPGRLGRPPDPMLIPGPAVALPGLVNVTVIVPPPPPTMVAPELGLLLFREGVADAGDAAMNNAAASVIVSPARLISSPRMR